MAITTAVQVANLAMRRIGEAELTSITSPTTPTEELVSDIYEIERDILLGGPQIESGNEVVGPHEWTFAKRHLQLDLGPGYVTNEGEEQTITGITNANPAVVTLSAAPTFDDYFNVLITDVAGMTQINNRVVRAVSINVGAKTFACYGVDSSDWDAYTSGGSVIRYEVLDAYSGGWSYKVPADCLRPIRLENRDARWEIIGSVARGGTSEGYGRLLTDHEDAKLIYIAYVTDVTTMSFEFIKTWAAKLAYEVSIALAKKAAEVEKLYQLFLLDYKMAISNDISRRKLGSLIQDKNRMKSFCGWA
jgi:hypothetical protein